MLIDEFQFLDKMRNINNINNINISRKVPECITINSIPKTSKHDTSKDCIICLEEFTSEKMYLTNCNHYYCIECLHKYFKSNNNNIHTTPTNTKCPMCRENITEVTFIKI
jgi:hypothetical protein